MSRSKMGWNATFSMAVGGMIGGGIFSVLGVVVDIAGPWAWASFVLGGALAFVTALSYIQLAERFGEGGGAFTFLGKIGHPGVAGSLSWLLIAGYVLTTAVYAFTFGHYLSEVIGGGGLLARLLSVGIMATLAAVNVRGVGDASIVEIVTVWAKLAVLGLLAGIGIARWEPANLATDSHPTVGGVVLGAAAIFMAYEGFQLLTYDYDDIDRPDRTLRLAVLPAVLVVTATYIAVTVGAAMLVGSPTLVAQKEVALAAAGAEAAGTLGKVIVSIAAAFSAASAINATLFATARLTRRIADAGDLPRFLGARNDRGVPQRAVLVLGAAGTALAAIGSLGGLVEAASLTFLVTFAGVDYLAATGDGGRRWLPAIGALAASAAGATVAWRLATREPASLIALAVIVVAAVAVRPMVLHGSDA
jgi:amino acid transporter